MTRKLGAFVSVAGGLKNAIVNGNMLGVNTIMIHPSPPQRWCTKPFDPKAIEEYLELKKTSKIENVYFHGIYLSNLAHPVKQTYHLSKVALVHYLNLAEAIGANGVVFHVGSFKDTTEEAGFAQIIKGINWILKEAPGKTPLMLEVAAGSGSVVGDRFEELKRIRDGVDNKNRVKFCLDTMHLFGSGYDIVNNLEGVVKEMDEILGIENIIGVHFNDSKVEFNSHRDRHENLGKGKIGEEAMKAFLNHPKLKNLSYIMETPGLKEPETALIEVKKLLSWAK